MRTGGAILLAGSLLATAAIASTRPPLERPASPWRSLTTGNFVVETDLPSGQAAVVLAWLEATRSRVAHALAVETHAPPLHVALFASRQELELYVAHGEQVTGIFIVDYAGQPHMVLAGDAGTELRRTIAHQVTASVAGGAFARQQRWLAEGLANQVYVSHPLIGEPLSPSMLEQLGTPPLSVKQLFAWGFSGSDMNYGYSLQRFVASSYLVEMLAQRYAAPFAELQQRLASDEEPVQAWNAAFPAWNQSDDAALARLDAVLLSHWTNRKKPAPEEPPKPPRFEERAMSVSEMYTLRLELPHVWPTDVQRALVDAALASDPGNVMALMSQARDARAGLSLSRKAVAAHPEDAQAWRFLAWNLAGAQNAKERESALRKALSLDPRRTLISLDLTVDLLAQNRNDEALAVVSAAVKQDPRNTNALFLRARALAAANQCPLAVTAARHALGVVTDHERKETQEQMRAEVQNLERKCGSREANRADALVHQARQALAAGEQEQAAALLQEAAALDPGDRDVWNELGLALLRLDRPAEAAAAIQKQLELVPRHPRAWNSLGLARARLGQFAEAEAAYRKQLEVVDDQRDALANLSRLLLRTGRGDDARIAADRLLTLEPRNVNATLLLARAQILSGYKSEGVERLRQLVKNVPGPVTLNIAAYELSLANTELDLANGWARRALTSAVERLRGAANDDEALAQTQSLAATWDTLGFIQFLQGELASAERYLRAAERIHRSAEVSDHLGRLFEKTGRREEAIRAYARALASSAPEFEINGRLGNLIGAANAADLIAKARLELTAMRSFKVPSNPDRGAQPDLLLAFNPDGTVADVRASGGAVLPAGAKGLRGQSLKLELPVEGAVPLLRARYLCADDGCTADFGHR